MVKTIEICNYNDNDVYLKWNDGNEVFQIKDNQSFTGNNEVLLSKNNAFERFSITFDPSEGQNKNNHQFIFYNKESDYDKVIVNCEGLIEKSIIQENETFILILIVLIVVLSILLIFYAIYSLLFEKNKTPAPNPAPNYLLEKIISSKFFFIIYYFIAFSIISVLYFITKIDSLIISIIFLVIVTTYLYIKYWYTRKSINIVNKGDKILIEQYKYAISDDIYITFILDLFLFREELVRRFNLSYNNNSYNYNNLILSKLVDMIYNDTDSSDPQTQVAEKHKPQNRDINEIKDLSNKYEFFKKTVDDNLKILMKLLNLNKIPNPTYEKYFDELIKKIQGELELIDKILELLNTKSKSDLISELNKIIEKWKNFFNDLNERLKSEDEESITQNKLNNIDDIIILIDEYKKMINNYKDYEEDLLKMLGEDPKLYNLTQEHMNRINNTFQNRTALLELIEIVANFFGTDTSKLDTIKKDKQEFSEMSFDKSVEYLENKEAFLPNFILTTQKFLITIDKDIDIILEKMDSNSEFKNLFEIISVGSNKNAGIKEAKKIIGSKGNRIELFKLFKVDKFQEFIDIDEKRFYNEFLSSYFIPVIDDISRIFLYKNINFDGMCVKDDFIEQSIDVSLVDEIFYHTKASLKEIFQIDLITPVLFHDMFDNTKHEQSKYANVHKLNNKLRDAQTKLNRNIIYDIYSVGIISEKLGLNKKPKVAYKA